LEKTCALYNNCVQKMKVLVVFFGIETFEKAGL
jgi:hypothetical protein